MHFSDRQIFTQSTPSIYPINFSNQTKKTNPIHSHLHPRFKPFHHSLILRFSISISWLFFFWWWIEYWSDEWISIIISEILLSSKQTTVMYQSHHSIIKSLIPSTVQLITYNLDVLYHPSRVSLNLGTGHLRPLLLHFAYCNLNPDHDLYCSHISAYLHRVITIEQCVWRASSLVLAQRIE